MKLKLTDEQVERLEVAFRRRLNLADVVREWDRMRKESEPSPTVLTIPPPAPKRKCA